MKRTHRPEEATPAARPRRRLRRFRGPCSTCLLLLAIASAPARGSEAPPGAGGPDGDRTVLGIEGSRFTLNGEPTFLLGFSYYGGLGASEESLLGDLDDARRLGFNWLRLWATWESFGTDVSAVKVDGAPRKEGLERLRRLVEECDRRGIVVDVTLARGRDAREGSGRIRDLAAHRRAVTTIVEALRLRRNWYLDLANERDVGDDRWVGTPELKELRDLVRSLDPKRLVTASFGGHDLGEKDVREAVVEAGMDFLCPHRPREPGSPRQTEARTRETLRLAKEVGRLVPVHHQEPFRRGYGSWEPAAEDFLTDLRGAVAGGAAGWCFHNGWQRTAPDHEPRRSFDLRRRRLFDQLDEEERKLVESAAEAVAEPRRAEPPR